MRMIAITLISFLSLIFYLAVLSLALPEPALSWVALPMAWVVTPALLLHFWKAAPSIDVLAVERSEPEMQEAIARARAELPRFLDGLASGSKEAFIKYPVHTRHGTTEHVWGLAHQREGDQVIVSLASTPVHGFESGHEPEARERVPLDAVEDWMLFDRTGRVEGGYTHLAMVQVYRRRYGRLPKKAQLRQLDTFVDIHPRQYASD